MGKVTELKAMPPPKNPAKKKKAGGNGETMLFTGSWHGKRVVSKSNIFGFDELEKIEKDEMISPVYDYAEDSYKKLFKLLDELHYIRCRFNDFFSFIYCTRIYIKHRKIAT